MAISCLRKFRRNRLIGPAFPLFTQYIFPPSTSGQKLRNTIGKELLPLRLKLENSNSGYSMPGNMRLTEPL